MGVFVGSVTEIAPLPCPVKAAEPIVTGAANEPPASESWAEITLPLAKLLPVTENPMLNVVPAQPLRPNWLMASTGTALGCTSTRTLAESWQPLALLTYTKYLPLWLGWALVRFRVWPVPTKAGPPPLV